MDINQLLEKFMNKGENNTSCKKTTPNMHDEIILKNRLKVARAERNLSQQSLAKMIGVSRQTISSIETGQFCPTAKLAAILCIVLEKNFEDLFYLE